MLQHKPLTFLQQICFFFSCQLASKTWLITHANTTQTSHLSQRHVMRCHGNNFSAPVSMEKRYADDARWFFHRIVSIRRGAAAFKDSDNYRVTNAVGSRCHKFHSKPSKQPHCTVGRSAKQDVNWWLFMIECGFYFLFLFFLVELFLRCKALLLLKMYVKVSGR